MKKTIRSNSPCEITKSDPQPQPAPVAPPHASDGQHPSNPQIIHPTGVAAAERIDPQQLNPPQTEPTGIQTNIRIKSDESAK